MPYITKTADILNTHPGDVVTYTYTFFNDHFLLPATVNRIEDDYFGDIWVGVQLVLAGQNHSWTHQRTADCTTITNRARAYYLI